MKTVLFATSNKGKAKEVKKILWRMRVVVKDLDLPEAKHLQHEKLVELKAKAAFRILKKPVVVEDTGLFVEGFKDYPGLRSREVLETIGLKGFLEKCRGRKAFFRTIAGYCTGKKVFLFKGVCNGRIAGKAEGRKIRGLPYLKVFIPKGARKPVAAFSKRDLDEFLVEKNHRAKAFKKLDVFLQESG